MVNGAGGRTHTKLDARTFQRRTCGGGAGDHASFAAQNHFSVGADVHHQDRLFGLIQFGGQDTAQSVGTHIAGDIGDNQKVCMGADGQDGFAGDDSGFCQSRCEGDGNQIIDGNTQKDLLHGRIANHADDADFLGPDCGIFTHAVNKLCHCLTNQGALLRKTAACCAAKAGYHIRTEGTLGIWHRADRQLFTAAIDQVANYGGGANVKGYGKTVSVGNRRCGGDAALQHLQFPALWNGYGHVPVYGGMAGERFFAVDENFAFATLAAAAAGGIRCEVVITE